MLHSVRRMTIAVMGLRAMGERGAPKAGAWLEPPSFVMTAFPARPTSASRQPELVNRYQIPNDVRAALAVIQ